MDKLTPAQSLQLRDILLGAYSRNSLEQMLWYRLGRKLDHIVAEAGLGDVVFALIKVAEENDWTVDLVAAARESRPRNAALMAFSQQFGLAPEGLPEFSSPRSGVAELPVNAGLETMVRMSNRFLNVQLWLDRLGEITGQVCRVDIKGEGMGTGFLVGPDLVMTNYHVVEQAITGENGIAPSDVSLRFDFKMLSDGRTINSGSVFALAAGDWLMDSSPPNPSERPGAAGGELPKPDQLDYALLRTAARPGETAVGKTDLPLAGERPRGWLRVKRQHDFAPGTPLFIVQHPLTAPLRLALETDAVIGLNENKTRVTYRTNTVFGSSGSPVFDQNWDLVALHHGFEANQNRGVPFGAIAKLFDERGLTSDLSA